MSGVPAQSSYPWRVALFLFAAAMLSVAAVMPYILALIAPLLAGHPPPLPLPLLATIQGCIYFGFAVGLGLLIARRIGLGAPFLEAWLYCRPITGVIRTLAIGAGTGLVLGTVVRVAIMSPLGRTLRKLPISEADIPFWKRFLACFYGGLGEELVFRLFLLSLVLWGLSKLFRVGPRGDAIFWTSNLLVAIAFGAGHLPFAATLIHLSPAMIGVIIGLNAVAALGFGYLYWRYCLEAAMVAHFCADLVLHVFAAR